MEDVFIPARENPIISVSAHSYLQTTEAIPVTWNTVWEIALEQKLSLTLWW
jgi:hypothetical protein